MHVTLKSPCGIAWFAGPLRPLSACLWKRCLSHARSWFFMQSDDPVDPKPALEKKCKEPCTPLWDLYLKCETRVAKSKEGTCEPWFFDYTKCVDKCVSACLAQRRVRLCAHDTHQCASFALASWRTRALRLLPSLCPIFPALPA